MSITGLLNRVTSRDKAVYWGNPIPNVYGGLSFDAPVEINCFWIDATRAIMSREGREIISEAEVYVTEDLAQNGMLYHGALTDLTQAQKDDPRKAEKAYEIIRFTKVPALHTPGEYVRVAYLSTRRIS